MVDIYSYKIILFVIGGNSCTHCGLNCHQIGDNKHCALFIAYKIEYLASIKYLRGRPIILLLLICFSYLLQLNIISLRSTKITLAVLFITCFM